MSEKKEISIIIVNYNNYLLTQRCIESILSNISNIEYEIIILDNCSQNDSYEKLKQVYLNNINISIIKNNVNVGFGGGNNIAVENSKYDNLLLLNPDIFVLDDSIDKMLNRLLSCDDIGIIGCKLLNEDGTLQYSCRRFIPFTKFLLARTPLKKIIGHKKVEKINESYLMKDYDHLYEKNVDWIMGSCLMLRKKDFWDVGGFSKEYFMYFEDVDLSYKIKIKGKKVLYFPNAKMIHLHKQESTKKINKLTFMHLISMIKFYKKISKEFICNIDY